MGELRRPTWYWRIWWAAAYNLGLYRMREAWRRWTAAEKKLGAAMSDAATSTVAFAAVAGPLVMAMPAPRGDKIQVLRQISAVGKTWVEWQTVELVSFGARSVVVRYPDGREVTVKKSRTREAT